jgi:hypothetical protein
VRQDAPPLDCAGLSSGSVGILSPAAVNQAKVGKRPNCEMA